MLLTPAPALDFGVEAEVLSLNRDCACLPVDTARLPVAVPDPSRYFGAAAVMVSCAAHRDMLEQVAAIEAAVTAPGYRAAVLGRAGLTDARSGTRGLLMGYDFHVTGRGPKLIEVNTNAGGAFLAAEAMGGRAEAAALVAMVVEEWHLAGRAGRPRLTLIVDEDPAGQFLYPDMVRACDLLNAAGMPARVADRAELRFDGRVLRHRGDPVDMIYNRLTDFSLSQQGAGAIRAAHEADAVVLSPAPHHHTLYADKRNLVLLSDPEFVSGLGLAAADVAALARLPRCTRLTAETADALWEARRGLFFKPTCGFGSRGVYRGDKLTRRVWGEIVGADYIAQAFVPPPARRVAGPDGVVAMKWDLRLFVYAGRPLLMAARLYQGQATNFRTPGGGFAPVVICDRPAR